MSGKKGRSGGHNKKAVTWNGQQFESRRELETHLEVKKGYLSWYLKNDRPLKGFYIDYLI